MFLLKYPSNAKVIDYRPTINSAGTRIVFERQVLQGAGYGVPNLFISDLVQPSPQRLVNLTNTARADWCWRVGKPFEDGPIAFSTDNGVFTVAPVAGSAPAHVPNSAGWIYPDWFNDCRTLAVYASNAIPYTASGAKTQYGPETYAVDVASGAYAKSLSGQSLWAGFPSVSHRFPGLLAFAGQQFSASGYLQDFNYVYLADFRGRSPVTRPLDLRASTRTFDPRYQGRAPTWSPDGRWIAFESNRTCTSDASLYAIFVQDALGSRPAVQITSCSYNVQHAKWYRQPVNGRTLLIATALLHPSAGSDQPLLRAARGIASLDVTTVVRP